MFRFLFGNQRPVSPARTSFRPQLEILEGRTLPSGFGPQTFVHNEPAQIFIHNVTASHFTNAPGTTAAQQVSGAGAMPARDTVSIEKEILRLTNQERQKAGLKPVVEDASLTRAAQNYSALLASRQAKLESSEDHFIGGTTPWDRAMAAGFPHSQVWENATLQHKTAEDAVQGWMSSTKGHRGNILDPNHTQIGVGVAYSSTGVPYYVQMFA
jgi:uncharacterized protein YkwD